MMEKPPVIIPVYVPLKDSDPNTVEFRVVETTYGIEVWNPDALVLVTVDE